MLIIFTSKTVFFLNLNIIFSENDALDMALTLVRGLEKLFASCEIAQIFIIKDGQRENNQTINTRAGDSRPKE